MTLADAPPTRVVIAGVSTRAAAESAARAGFAVTSFDAYADLDQHATVHAHAIPRTARGRFSPHRAASAARDHRADAAIYLSSFENHPAAVSRLGDGRALWGNSPAVLERVRDPFDVAGVLARRGFAVPALAHPTASRRMRIAGETVRPGSGGHGWMIKPRRSGGGRGVRVWRPGLRLSTQAYLQARVEGIAGSIVFVADGQRALTLGVSRQLVGDPAFGATGYQYCGSLLGPADALFERSVTTAASADGGRVLEIGEHLATAATQEYGLIGVNGIDFIVSGGVPWPIEINPRWCSSMELVERAHGLSVFGAHAAACAQRALPRLPVPASSRSPRIVGKAVVFARHRVRVGRPHAWLVDPDVRDVPHPGEQIDPGQPICTVFADANTAGGCYAALVSRALEIYRMVAEWSTEAA